jgi:hypothetical protein
MNFEKPKEVFSQNGPNNNNLSHISHSCYRMGESKTSLGPIFGISFATCFTHLFQTQIRTDGDEFHKTKRGFCSEHADLQKPPPYFTQLSISGRYELVIAALFLAVWSIFQRKI